ncbi:MAG: AAA family ATPase [Tissierellia bacterium]|nr:AAA family ATPase [Tissierellia bacterium]
MQLTLDTLTLCNYRYYYGKQNIHFSNDPEKNVTVIKGDNGAGKSNILNALTWCLYNEEVHADKKTASLPSMNTEYIAELALNNKEGEASVTLTINVDGEIWEIKRTITGYGEKDPAWTEEEPKYRFHESFNGVKVTYPSNGDYKIVEGVVAQQLINELLPSALRSFFFIDGEQLREFFKVDASDNLQEAIEKLSQLELIKKTESSLETYRKYLRDKLRDNNPATSQVQNAINEKETLLSKLKNDKERIKKQSKDYQIEIELINDFLQDYNIGTISHLSKEKLRLEKSIKDAKGNYEKELTSKNQYLVTSAPRILLKDTIDDAYNIINQLIEVGDLPPKIKESFIQELLEKGTCVCGTPLTDESRKTLKDYAEKIQISELTGIAFEGKAEFAKHQDLIQEFPEKIDSFNQKLESYEDEINKWNIELKENMEELLKYDINEINENVRKSNELAQKIGEINIKIKATERRIEDTEKDLRSLYIKENTEKEKSKAHSEYSDKIELVQDTLKVLKNVEERVKERIRLSLEENTKKYFLSFLREEGLFRDVMIDRDYKVSVINNQGWNNLGDLSAGQYLILGYAFVVALRTITGYQAPVIVDTPLGKLDPIHQDNITKNIPKLLDKAQLIFLVTSSEYTSTVQMNLSPYMDVSSYYEIHKCQNKTSARLIQYGN